MRDLREYVRVGKIPLIDGAAGKDKLTGGSGAGAFSSRNQPGAGHVDVGLGGFIGTALRTIWDARV